MDTSNNNDEALTSSSHNSSTDKGNVSKSNENDGKPETKEHTRSRMALLFIIGFFAILFLTFAYALKTNSSLSELKDILVAIIGSLSGIIGFIVGYYYKSTKDD